MREVVKRILDVVFAATALIVLSPVFLVVALCVRVCLGTPIFFAQQRPGHHGRIFTMYKFRTMTNANSSAVSRLSDEQRLTKLGKFLRSSSMDELPELLNVLRGEMSLVGPRPLLVQYLDRYSLEQMRRHQVKPGITGWAQVNGRNAISWDEKFRLDLWYVDHYSVLLDLWILALTVWRVVFRTGISAENHATMPEFLGTKR